jgi:hypothetical protein
MMKMDSDVTRIVDTVVGEQDYSNCEKLDAGEVGGSVQDRKTNYLNAL